MIPGVLFPTTPLLLLSLYNSLIAYNKRFRSKFVPTPKSIRSASVSVIKNDPVTPASNSVRATSLYRGPMLSTKSCTCCGCQ
eukprot:UN18698